MEKNVQVLYTCEDVAKRYSVSVSTVWKWIREGKLSALTVGKGYRIRGSAINAFDSANETKQKK